MKKKQSKYIPKYPKGGIMDNIKDAAVYGAEYALSPLTIGTQLLTGQDPASLMGYTPNSQIGDMGKKYMDMQGKMAPQLASMGANAIAPGSGALVGMGTNMSQGMFNSYNNQQPGTFANGGSIMNTQRLYDKPNYTTPYLFKYPDGGNIDYNKNWYNKYLESIMRSGMQHDMLNNSQIGANKYSLALSLMSSNAPDNIKYSDNSINKLRDALDFYDNKTKGFKNGGIKYAEGGTGEINAEVEREENAITPQGEFNQYDGPDHNSGGIKTDLPNGSIIFSDRLKPKGSKKTYAQLNKVNNTKKEDKILDNDKSTIESKRTAELMKSVKNKNSASLFKNQEEQKQFDADKQFVKSYNKYLNGGVLNTPDKLVAKTILNYLGNKYKNGGKVTMSKPEFMQEHKELVRILKSGTKAEQLAEANEQAEEMSKYPDGGLTPNRYRWALDQKNMGNTQLSGTMFYNPSNYQYNTYSRPDDKNYIPSGTDVSGAGLFTNPQGQQFYYGNGAYQPYQGQGTIPVEAKFAKGGMMSGYKKYAGVPPYNVSGFVDDNPHAYAEYQANQPTYKSGDWQNDYKQAYGMDYNSSKFPYNDNNSVNPPISNGNITNNTPDPYRFGNYSQKDLSPIDNNSNTSNHNNFNYKDAAYYGAGTLAQSAGALDYLHRNKTWDKQAMHTYTPKYLDPAAALRQHQLQINAANADLSRYNSGNYTANRVALGANAALGQAGIRTDYENQNSQIGNQADMFNTQNQFMVDDRNQANKDAWTYGRLAALNSIGTNTASGMRDYRADKYDQQKMGMLQDMFNSPEYQELLKKNGYYKRSV